jgi:hypothetical protein
MVENAVRYKAFDLTGELATSPEEAELLHEKLKTALKEGHRVDLDFAGVKAVYLDKSLKAKANLYWNGLSLIEMIHSIETTKGNFMVLRGA